MTDDTARPDENPPTRARRQHQPLDISFEIKAVDGPDGEALAKQQATAIHAVLCWFVAQHPPETTA